MSSTRFHPSSPLHKNIPLLASPKSALQLPPSHPLARGVSRSARTLGWDAVGVAASGANAVAGRVFWPRERQAARQTNGADADGEAVWSWHPLLVSSWRRQVGPTGRGHAIHPPMTVARRIRRRGERGVNR